MIRINPNNEEGPVDKKSMNPAVLDLRNLKLPCLNAPKLFIEAGEAIRLRSALPIQGVTPERFRLILLQFFDGETMQSFQAFEKLLEIAFLAPGETELFVRENI